MAFFSRRGNYGYSRYKKWKGSSNRRSKNSFKAARQTRDSLNMVIKCNTCFCAAYDAVNDGGCAVINIYEVLRNNPQFTSFIKLYDQVKVGGIKAKLSVVDASTSVANISQIKNINVVTAWDRTGISRKQVDFFNAAEELIVRTDWDISGASFFAPHIGKGIVNATDVDKSVLSSFQRWTRTPFLYPSTMEEKSQYLSTSNFEDVIVSFNFATNKYRIDTSNDNTPITELFNTSNPCLPFESPSCKWKPTLIVGVFKSVFDNTEKKLIQFASYNPVLFNAEFSIDVTFRNMKASQNLVLDVSGLSKLEIKTNVIPNSKSLQEIILNNGQINISPSQENTEYYYIFNYYSYI
ncbi:hypothetical protein PIROE2DRAFT_2830 [Piromyces sp. E2]|nr:hypothetical protein PIROE2DRAFT_2830 [Piromyces sp. E2]|eukprot:OUM69325.1 hypothetical protein PIROE2DRAFT_2830 [Piromyces sp. E2]